MLHFGRKSDGFNPKEYGFFGRNSTFRPVFMAFQATFLPPILISCNISCYISAMKRISYVFTYLFVNVHYIILVVLFRNEVGCGVVPETQYVDAEETDGTSSPV